MTAHIVLFQPKASASDADRTAFSRQFERACREIPSVRRAIVGRAASIDAGYTRFFDKVPLKYAARSQGDDGESLRSSGTRV